MKVKPIDPKLKPLLDEFLNQEELQPKFLEKARNLGYTGNDPDKIRVALFTPDFQTNEICFADPEITELFVDFQIIKQLSMVEPYKTLLELHPERKPQLVELSKVLLTTGKLDTDILLSLFSEEIATINDSNNSRPDAV